MAHIQWQHELTALQDHERNTLREKDALASGVRIWTEVVSAIEAFESKLAAQMRAMRSGESASMNTEDLVRSLDQTLHLLSKHLSVAEKRDWTLLIAAIGAEVEAFHQARLLLDPDSIYHNESVDMSDTTSLTGDYVDSHPDDTPDQDLLTDQTVIHHDNGDSDNESLQQTLKGIHLSSSARLPITNGDAKKKQVTRYSSEDDDPGPDFFVG